MAAKTSKGTQPKTPKAPKPKAPPPTPEAVAGRLLAEFASGGEPALWKEADLKRRLTTKERPVLAEAVLRLQADRLLLVLTQGKTRLYLFAEPLRGWLGEGMPAATAPTLAPGDSGAVEDLPAIYARLVRESGGFPDVKISALRAALGSAGAGALSAKLLELWREGRATFSQGDWSLADESTRAAAVELSGERYLLVRLEE